VVILGDEDDVKSRNDLDMVVEVAIGIAHGVSDPLGIWTMDASLR